MPDKDNKDKVDQRVSEAERFRYIGFEVFPGKPKDLFKSEQEKARLIDAVIAKRSKGEIIREECTLLEDRVSGRDRAVLTFACVLILISLFIPWYTVYNEVVQEAGVGASQAIPSDTSALAGVAGGDTAGAVNQQSSSEEVIHGMLTRKKVTREYSRLSGLGAFLALGGVGSAVFSSGFVLILTGIIFLLYTLLSLALPVYTLYGLYGVKGNPDERALALKKIVRFCWIPVALFVGALFISFLGADYGFNATASFSSLGDAYGIGVFLSCLSWGILMSLCAFILIATKGIEI